MLLASPVWTVHAPSQAPRLHIHVSTTDTAQVRPQHRSRQVSCLTGIQRWSSLTGETLCSRCCDHSTVECTVQVWHPTPAPCHRRFRIHRSWQPCSRLLLRWCTRSGLCTSQNSQESRTRPFLLVLCARVDAGLGRLLVCARQCDWLHRPQAGWLYIGINALSHQPMRIYK